ncbi:hypothetical protein AURANDRAFT_5862, partial [Aureococcus anophagefferens]
AAVQVVRSVGRWSLGAERRETSAHAAWCDAIANAERFLYVEQQFWITSLDEDAARWEQSAAPRLRRAIGKGETFRALLVLPLHPNGRFLDSEEVHGVMQQQFCSICRGPGSLLGKLAAEFPAVDLDRYVKFCCLRTFQDLDAGPASEMVYVHSKLLVADDAVAIVGSANVNDRSLLGDRDTEVCLVVEDRAAV